MSEVVISALALIFVMITFQKAVKPLVDRVDELTQEMRELRREVVELVKKIVNVENTYVTRVRCEELRNSNRGCGEHE